MKTYNGHRSWNAWNVSLWIGNDEPLYNLAIQKRDKALIKFKDKNRAAGAAARWFIQAIGIGSKTPDGASYNQLSVKLAMLGLMDE